MRNPLAILVSRFDRLGRHEAAAATIAGFAGHPLTALAFPEINTSIAHLRDALAPAPTAWEVIHLCRSGLRRFVTVTIGVIGQGELQR